MAEPADGRSSPGFQERLKPFKRKPLLKRLSLNWEPDIEDVKDGLTAAYDDGRADTGQQPVHDRTRR